MPLLQVLEDRHRLGDHEVAVLEDRNLGERVQAAERRLAQRPAGKVDLDLLEGQPLLPEGDLHPAGHDREGVPVEPEHRSS